jgi:hypothetical protein
MVAYMNPLVVRRQVNNILNSNRKKKLLTQSFAVSKERLGNDNILNSIESTHNLNAASMIYNNGFSGFIQ